MSLNISLSINEFLNTKEDIKKKYGLLSLFLSKCPKYNILINVHILILEKFIVQTKRVRETRNTS